MSRGEELLPNLASTMAGPLLARVMMGSFNGLIDRIHPAMIHDARLREIAVAIRSLKREGKPYDPIAVLDRLGSSGKLKDGLTGAFIAALMNDPATDPEYALMRVRQDFARLQVIRKAGGIEQAASADCIDGALVRRLGTQLARHLPVALGDIIDEERRALTAVDIAGAISGPVRPVDYVVAPLIVKGEIALLAGMPKLGKSWTSLDLAVALATGGKFLGALPVCGGPYRVLYVDEENSEALVRYRLRKIAAGLALPPEAFANLRYLRGNGINLDEPAGRDALHREAKGWGAEFIILDSLIRFHRRDENSNAAMSSLYTEILKPLAATLAGGLIALHHLSKPAPKEDRELVSRIRGAGDILAAVDGALTLERDGDGLLLKLAAGRWLGGGGYHIEIVDTEDGEGVRLMAQEAEAKAAETIRTALQEAGTAGMLRSEVVALLQAEGIAKDTADRQVTRELGRLSRSGLVRKESEPGRGVRAVRYLWNTDRIRT